jgi:alkylation response protein AidB-like acyl-CoA dehydrogenase
VPIATTDEQRAVAAAVHDWAAKANPVATTRSHEDTADAWRKHWPELAGLGLHSIAVPAEFGGAGGSLTDLAVALEACAQALVPGPLLGTALAAALLSRSASVGHTELLSRIAAGELHAAVALPPATGPTLSARQSAAGGMIVDGVAGPVAGADADAGLVLPVYTAAGDVWCWVPPGSAGLSVVDLNATDFSRAVGQVSCREVDVPAENVLAGVDTDLVTELTATLAAAEASGIAAWSLRTAVDYAKVREQFGAPIGSFQAVKHLCAEMLCRVEQCAALAWDAAEWADDGEHRPLAAAAAAAVAIDAAVETAKDCIQVLGGIGFTWEHDAHLYLRRAVALRQLLGGTAAWRRRVADATLAGARRELHVELAPDADGGIDRAGIRAGVAAIAALPVEQRRAELADAGYLVPHWPAPYGLAAGPIEQLVIDEELSAAGVHRPDLVIAGWAVPTILQAGTDAQRERFVRPSLRGELVWCQLFSEPGAGSDLASLRTRAVRVDGGWRLTGQKVWTSVAATADWGICLARTDPNAPKHKGISYFLVDMRSAGIEVRPLREMTGEALFNEVFLDDVFVPDELVVGDVDDGWRLARATLVNERVAMSGGSGIDAELEVVLGAARERGIDDATLLDRLGREVAVGISGSLLDVRATLRRMDGHDAAAESSVRKLIGVRHRQATAELGLDLLGPDGLVDSPHTHAFLMTRCLTIAGGTTQVLLTLAAERILGLPRG